MLLSGKEMFWDKVILKHYKKSIKGKPSKSCFRQIFISGLEVWPWPLSNRPGS